MIILAIDPGADAGWALFKDKTLVQCGLGPFPHSLEVGKVGRLVIERPHAGQTRARKKDVITLALRAGELGGIFSYFFKLKPEYIEPNRWKGQQSKAISHSIIRAKLSAAEMKVVERCIAKIAAGKRHNVLDAIGIGLFSCGRY